MKQVKGILFDLKDAGWTKQRVEKELGFSNGSLGKKISDFRYCKLLEFHKKIVKKVPTVTKELEEQIAENNKPEKGAKIQEERDGVTKIKRYDYSAMPQGLLHAGREAWKKKAREEQDKTK